MLRTFENLHRERGAPICVGDLVWADLRESSGAASPPEDSRRMPAKVVEVVRTDQQAAERLKVTFNADSGRMLFATVSAHQVELLVYDRSEARCLSRLLSTGEEEPLPAASMLLAKRRRGGSAPPGWLCTVCNTANSGGERCGNERCCLKRSLWGVDLDEDCEAPSSMPSTKRNREQGAGSTPAGAGHGDDEEETGERTVAATVNSTVAAAAEPAVPDSCSQAANE